MNNQPINPTTDEFVIPNFNPSQFDSGNLNSVPNFNMPDNNFKINMQPEMNNQNPFIAPPMSDQTMNVSTSEVIKPINNDLGITQNNNTMPINDFKNISPMEHQNNPFATPQEQPNPFDMNQGPTIEPIQPLEPMNNMPEMSSMNNPFQMEITQQPIDNSYGAGFAPQVTQPNPAIDKIKILVDELRNNGFNIELSEADLMDSFQLTINIKK